MRVARTCQFGKAGRYALLGRKTASGEMLDSVTATAAHRSLPLTSLARVTDLDNGRSVIVKINDRGPYARGRIIDLSPRTAEALDMKAAGVAAVVVQPVSNRAETNHRCVPKPRYSDTHQSQRPGRVLHEQFVLAGTAGS
jgi:rare lipoprotein A